MTTVVDTEEAQAIEKTLKKVLGERSCHTCAHMIVCALYIGIQPLLNSLKPKPFESKEIAWVCKAYMPIASISALSEA